MFANVIENRREFNGTSSGKFFSKILFKVEENKIFSRILF